MLAEYSTKTIANATTANTAETVVAQLPSVSNYGSGNRVQLHGYVNIQPGATTTGLTFRIRRGVDATGLLVSSAINETAGLAAGAAGDYTIDTEESPAEIAGASYVLTVQQAAGTAGGTINAVEFKATVG